jgi:hypothetical protein
MPEEPKSTERTARSQRRDQSSASEAESRQFEKWIKPLSLADADPEKLAREREHTLLAILDRRRKENAKLRRGGGAPLRTLSA